MATNNMGKIKEEIVEELLSAKTELEFIKIAYSEKMPQSKWEKYVGVSEHYKNLKMLRSGISVYDNIGFLREKNK